MFEVSLKCYDLKRIDRSRALRCLVSAPTEM
ncbi:Uncharacterised protein [Vibrio cholerae]|nr:Uncharacterised protein [Vibrio cholerae]